jgi:5-methylcytosine-specific restriction endonuclease McrA
VAARKERNAAYSDDPILRARKSKLSKARYTANRDKILADSAARYAAHPEIAAARQKAHPERCRANYARYVLANPEEVHLGACRRSAKWRKTHPETVRIGRTRWNRQHPEKVQLMHAKRRLLKYDNTPLDEMLTSTEWLAILAEANGHCAYCGKEAKLTLDHVIPLSKGGKHNANNVVPACAHCNGSKGNKTLEEWWAKKQREAVSV